MFLDDTLRAMEAALPKYPVPSNCWLCGRFGHGARSGCLRRCEACDVRWHELLPGTDPRKPVDRERELGKLRAKYMPAGDLTGRPADIFDDFIDHATVKLGCPA